MPLDDLDDHCFVLATELVVELCTEAENALGEKLTLNELCELLTWGIRSCATDILQDIDPANVVALKAKIENKKRGKIRLEAGDVLAVSAKGGGYHLLVYIMKENRFGWAYGIIKGKHKLKPLPPNWRPKVVPHPVFSDGQYLRSGRWKVLGNYPNLLSLFPKDPEIYHRKEGYNEKDPQIGPWGSGEKADGTLRNLTKEEAEEIGLLSGDYNQSWLSESFESLLENLCRE